MLVFTSIYAGEVNSEVILTAARRWIAANAVFKAELPVAEPVETIRMTNADGEQLPLWHVLLLPSGYLIMSADDTLPPVVAFDPKASFSQSSPTPLPAMLAQQGSIFQEALIRPLTRGNTVVRKNQARWQELLSPTRTDSVTPSTIITAPMLTSAWKQNYPYNYLCPQQITNTWYGTKEIRLSVAGCVPVAFAQLLKYHEWPIIGKGMATHQDNTGLTTGSFKTDFSFPYQWNLMRDMHDSRTADMPSILAASRLIMEMGCFAKVNYEIDSTGGSANIFKKLLVQNFGYAEDVEYGDTYSYSEYYIPQQTLFSRIKEDLITGSPVLLTYMDSDYYRHAFVGDGLCVMSGLDYYHFNYGWGGPENGWYLSNDGYNASVIDGATTKIVPKPIPMFKPMSVEQASTFTLSWDFPKRLFPQAFRLTQKTDMASIIIDSAIPGSVRSYTLTTQQGIRTYMLEAKVDGKWQPASDSIVITIKDAPVDMLYLDMKKDMQTYSGQMVSTQILSNNPLKTLTVSGNRPDILPDRAISIAGNGTEWSLELTPDASLIGNVLLYITATDTSGNTAKQTALLKVINENFEELEWHDNFTEAFSLAKKEGKWLLLLADEYVTQSESNKYNSYDWNSNKQILQENFVLLYVCYPMDDHVSHYIGNLGNNPPFITIINPENPRACIRGRGNLSQDELFDFLNPNELQLSLIDTIININGTKRKLEMSILQKGAVIHYRLDSKAPTISDPVYSEPLLVRDNTTVSARAFLHDVPIGDTTTKTYRFDSQIAPPVINKKERDYFVGSCLLTATCDTPGATIRYVSGYSRQVSHDAPVFPKEGLLVTETSCITLQAMKKENGVTKSSEVVSTQLVSLKELPEANAIVNKEDMTLYTSVSAPWVPQNDIADSSPYIIRSGYNNLSGVVYSDLFKKVSWLVVKVNGPGVISFDWKSIGDRNTFYLCLDETSVTYYENYWEFSLYDDDKWTPQTFAISNKGEHYVGWAFMTFDSEEDGVAWLDNISWKRLASLDIWGEDMLVPGENALHICTATWSDGSVSIVQPIWSLSPSEAADVDVAGTVTNKNKMDSDQTVTLTADYGGVSTTKNILLSKTKLKKTANPIFNKNELDFFTGNFLLTASCSTPNASIRYTMDGSIPTLDSHVFPSDGLLVSQSAIIQAKAFNDGMKASDCVQCKLVKTVEIPEISKDRIVFGNLDMPWIMQADAASSVTYSLLSPELNENETSSLVAIVNGPGILSFSCKSKMEFANSAYFSIDGQLKGIYEDYVSKWNKQTFVIEGKGIHYLVWEVVRREAIYKQEDHNFWIANITWSNLLDDAGFEYTVDDGFATIRKYHDDNPFVSIPETIREKTVIDIESETFRTRKDISAVILPHGLSHIHDYAFYGSSLASVTIPSSVTSVEEHAFAACSNLSEMVFKGCPPTFGTSSFPTPVTFFVPHDMGWEHFEAEGVTIVFREDAAVLTEIVISGDTTIANGSSSAFMAVAVWNDGTQTPITPQWNLFPDAYARLAENDITNINDTFEDRSLTLTARYTYNGITTTSQKTIVLLHKPPTPASLTLKIRRGWNLCSLPFIPDDDSLALLTSSHVCWVWSNGRFGELDNIQPGQGFWLYSDSDYLLPLNGTETNAKPLHKGWNLVGPAGSDGHLSTSKAAWRWNGKHFEYTEDKSKGFQRGIGYWIYCK